MPEINIETSTRNDSIYKSLNFQDYASRLAQMRQKGRAGQKGGKAASTPIKQELPSVTTPTGGTWDKVLVMPKSFLN